MSARNASLTATLAKCACERIERAERALVAGDLTTAQGEFTSAALACKLARMPTMARYAAKAADECEGLR